MPRKITQLFGATLLVLSAVKDGVPMVRVAGKLGVHKSNVRHRFTELEKAGLIEKVGRSSIMIWRLTKAGEYVLQQVLKGVGERNFANLLVGDKWRVEYRLHHLIYRFPRWDVEERGSELVAKGFVARRRGCVTGWEFADGLGSVFVTGKSVCVYLKPVLAGSVFGAVEEGLGKSIGLVRKVCLLLPWLKVDARPQVCREHLALMGVMQAWTPPNFNYKSDRLVIDFSTGTAEIETVNKEFAVDDMLKIAGFFEAVVRE